MIDKLTDADLQLIRSLVATPGVSGRESLVAAVIQSALPQRDWVINVDAIGNLTARKPGEGKKILFLAHMDEVGLIVQRITEDGFLKVERLGGISVHTLLGSALDLWTDSGRLDALVGAEPAHLVNGDDKAISSQDLFVDIGCSTRDEVFSMGVNIGDALTWKSDFNLLAGRRICGKALDNRLGCFALIKLANLLIDEETDADVSLAFVVQEECMIIESAPVISQLKPDLVIGVDGTLPFDSPDVQDQQSEIRLGKGPCIKLMDAIRGKISYLPDWDLTKKVIRFMDQQGLPYQPEIVIGLSTAVSLVPFMNKGIKTAGLSLPIRYHHSAVEVADLHDLECLINLMRLLLVRGVLT